MKGKEYLLSSQTTLAHIIDLFEVLILDKALASAEYQFITVEMKVISFFTTTKDSQGVRNVTESGLMYLIFKL